MLSGCDLSGGGSSSFPEGKSVRFAVVADPHFYDTDLGTEGEAFDAWVNEEIKMIAGGEAILQETIRQILDTEPKPEFLLIPGDLTADGDESSHQKLTEHLYALVDAGVDVWVVPGNHDISNPNAFAYTSQGPVGMYSPDAEQFAEIYRDFGYGRAIKRDPDSLSYIAEPVPGLWLFGIDSNRYRENVNSSIVGGRIAPETMGWLLENMRAARENDKLVIAMMHHGIVEHFLGQGDFMPDFIVQDWDAVGHELAVAGMNMMFTGHYHTQNVTRRDWDDGAYMVEIQTGSLLTYPVPFRIVDLEMGPQGAKWMEMAIESRFVDELPYGTYPDGFCCFGYYARKFTEHIVFRRAMLELEALYGMEPARAKVYAPLMTEAVMAHFAGDESPSFSTLLRVIRLANDKDPVISEIGLILASLWNDLDPSDNNLLIQIDAPPE